MKKRSSGKAKTASKNSLKKEQLFRTLDGKELSSILELAHELDTMADHVFYHHVTHDRNDFANWINDVFGEKELAGKLSNEKNKERVHFIILKHIVRRF